VRGAVGCGIYRCWNAFSETDDSSGLLPIITGVSLSGRNNAATAATSAVHQLRIWADFRVVAAALGFCRQYLVTTAMYFMLSLVDSFFYRNCLIRIQNDKTQTKTNTSVVTN
jgi:hypothetical protein